MSPPDRALSTPSVFGPDCALSSVRTLHLTEFCKHCDMRTRGRAGLRPELQGDVGTLGRPSLRPRRFRGIYGPGGDPASVLSLQGGCGTLEENWPQSWRFGGDVGTWGGKPASVLGSSVPLSECQCFSVGSRAVWACLFAVSALSGVTWAPGVSAMGGPESCP